MDDFHSHVRCKKVMLESCCHNICSTPPPSQMPDRQPPRNICESLAKGLPGARVSLLGKWVYIQRGIASWPHVQLSTPLPTSCPGIREPGCRLALCHVDSASSLQSAWHTASGVSLSPSTLWATCVSAHGVKNSSSELHTPQHAASVTPLEPHLWDLSHRLVRVLWPCSRDSTGGDHRSSPVSISQISPKR